MRLVCIISCVNTHYAMSLLCRWLFACNSSRPPICAAPYQSCRPMRFLCASLMALMGVFSAKTHCNSQLAMLHTSHLAVMSGAGAVASTTNGIIKMAKTTLLLLGIYFRLKISEFLCAAKCNTKCMHVWVRVCVCERLALAPYLFRFLLQRSSAAATALGWLNGSLVFLNIFLLLLLLLLSSWLWLQLWLVHLIVDVCPLSLSLDGRFEPGIAYVFVCVHVCACVYLTGSASSCQVQSIK